MYEAQNFESLLGTPGFSDEALKTHFGLYEGYVKNTNKLLELKETLDPETPEYAEVKRRFGWEWNGMRLHEYYFSGMSKDAESIETNSPLHQKLTEQFGSYEKWEEDFRNTATMRGVGWAVLAYDRGADKLMNLWVDEHDTGHLAAADIILNIDVFEHAFVIDYGMNRSDYIDAFMKAVDWQEVEGRLS